MNIKKALEVLEAQKVYYDCAISRDDLRTVLMALAEPEESQLEETLAKKGGGR